MPRVPIGRPLKGMRGPYKQGFIQVSSDELEAYRHTASIESTG